MSSTENSQELPEPSPGGSKTLQNATTPACFELRSPSGNAVFRMDWGGGGNVKKGSASTSGAVKPAQNGANGHAPVVPKSENDATTPLIIADSISESWLSAKANMKAAAGGSPPVGKLKVHMKNFQREKTTAKFVRRPTKAPKAAASSPAPSTSKSTATPKHITPTAKRSISPRKTAQESATTPKKSRDSVPEKLTKPRGEGSSVKNETKRKSKPAPVEVKAGMVLNGKVEDKKISSASKSAEQKPQKPEERLGTSAAAGRIARMNSSSSSVNGRSPSPSKKAVGLITPTGYQMTHLSASAKKRYWACIYRRAGEDPLGCHGTASSDLNCGEVKEWKEHNHPPGVAPDVSVAEVAVPAVNGATSNVAEENGGSVAQAQNGSPMGAPQPVSIRKSAPKPHAQTSATTSTPNLRGAHPRDAPAEEDDGSEWDDDYLPEIPMEPLMCNGYEMRADSYKSKKKRFYYCPKRKEYGCRGRAQTKLGSRYLQETIGHNHNPGQPPIELMSSIPTAEPEPSTSNVAEKARPSSTSTTPRENDIQPARKRGRPPKHPKPDGKGKNKENEQAMPKDRKRRSDAGTPPTPVKKSKKAGKERERAAMPGKVLLEILGGLDRNTLESLQLTCRGFKQYVDRGGATLHFRRVQSAKLSPKGAVMQLANAEKNDGGGQVEELRSELTLKTGLAAWFFKSLRYCVVERMEITGIAVTDSFVQALTEYATAVHVRHLQYTAVTAAERVQLSDLFEHFWYVHTIDFRGSRPLLSLVKDATLYKFCEKEFLRMILPRTSPQCKVTDISEDALLDFVYGESDEGKISPLMRTLDVQSPKLTPHFIQRLAKFHRDASSAAQPVSLNVQFPIEDQDIETPFAIPAHKIEHKSGYTLSFDGGLRIVWSKNQRCLRISRGAGNEKKETSP